MLDRCKHISVSWFFGYLLCLLVNSFVNGDGRVFVVNLRNSSGLEGFRDAERACALQQSRLASAQELHHAVAECFFSSCTRGWLYGGSVGTTVCNVVGGALKAVDVRTENTTGDNTHLNAFCIKDRGVPCGDPPSFPHARLQGHSGYEMGDELLYTCVPGYLMPSGHKAFSLLCDSCGEWYGLVEICVKDETVDHVDYEDKFPDSYEEADHHSETPAEAHGEVYEEVHGPATPNQKPQEPSFSIEADEEHRDQHEEYEVEGEVIGIHFEGRETDEERPVEDFIGHPRWEQERRDIVTTDAAPATEAPVSLLSQKHMFWFPSEAFQEDPISTNPATQTTQRASGAQSEESKEQESQERKNQNQHPVHVDDHDHYPDDDDDHNTDDQDDHNDSHHHDQDGHEDSHHDEDDRDSHQEEEDGDDHVKHYVPDRRDSHERHDDHYDMGEHEEERDRVHHGSQEYDDTYDEHEGYEDHEDLTGDHSKDSQEHLDRSQEHHDHSEEHPDRDDHDHDQHEEHYDQEDDDSEHYPDHHDHEHDDHDSYEDHDDHDTHEDFDDAHQHVIISIPKDNRQNITQQTAGGKVTTDDTWLDGYPVVRGETENGDSTTDRLRPEDGGRGTAIRTSDKPNEVELGRRIPYTNSPEVFQSPTSPSLEQGGVEEMLPGQPSDSPSYPDTLDYNTQQAAPTHSWLGGPTEHPFLDQDPAPPMQDSDVLSGVIEEHTLHNLPGEAGERGEIEGEMGEAMCPGENCTSPPPSSSGRGPTVAAIVAIVCLVAAAVIIGVWCYRRQQQKSSMYEMNGKGQSQSRHGQHIEMQQKV